MGPQQKAQDLYNTLSSKEKSLVDEMIYGIKPAAPLPPGMISERRLIKFNSQSSEIGKQEDESKATEFSPDESSSSSRSLQEYDEGDSVLSKRPPPEPLELDYENLVDLLAEMPSIFFEEGDDFPCDDSAAFKPFAVESAIERLGLRFADIEGFEKYAVGNGAGKCGQSQLTSSSSNSLKKNAKELYKEKRAVADASRFKRYLRVFSQRNPLPSPKKAYKTMRSLLLSILTNDSDARESVCILNGVEVIMDYLNVCNSVRVLEVLVPVLGCLAEKHKGRLALLAEHCAVVHVISCMKRFRSDKLLQEECIIALYKMTENSENTNQLAVVWGIPLLLQEMQRQKTNLSLQKNAFGILIHVAQNCMEYLLTNQDAFSVIVSSMNFHRSSEPLLHVGVILLRRCAFFDDMELTEKLIKAKVVEAITRAILAHPKSVKLCQHGFAILHLLCRSVEARTEIASSGHLPALVGLIKRHQNNVLIQRESFKMLRSLRELPAGKFKVHQAALKDTETASIYARAGLYGKVHKP